MSQRPVEGALEARKLQGLVRKIVSGKSKEAWLNP